MPQPLRVLAASPTPTGQGPPTSEPLPAWQTFWAEAFRLHDELMRRRAALAHSEPADQLMTPDNPSAASDPRDGKEKAARP